jgi:methyl coenzyme M reductase alpha subunit
MFSAKSFLLKKTDIVWWLSNSMLSNHFGGSQWKNFPVGAASRGDSVRCVMTKDAGALNNWFLGSQLAEINPD